MTTKIMLTLLIITSFTLHAMEMDPDQALRKAIENGDPLMAEQALEDGANIYKDQLGNTLLIKAILNHDPEIVKLLLKHNKYIVNIPDALGYTPLLLAMQCRNFEIVEDLVAAGARFTAIFTNRQLLGTIEKESPLSYAFSIPGKDSDILIDILMKYNKNILRIAKYPVQQSGHTNRLERINQYIMQKILEKRMTALTFMQKEFGIIEDQEYTPKARTLVTQLPKDILPIILSHLYKEYGINIPFSVIQRDTKQLLIEYQQSQKWYWRYFNNIRKAMHF